MSSSFGRKRGMVGYDEFRTGLTYRDVWEMLRDDSEDPSRWKHKSRGTVLGLWHELKLQMWQQMLDAAEQ